MGNGEGCTVMSQGYEGEAMALQLREARSNAEQAAAQVDAADAAVAQAQRCLVETRQCGKQWAQSLGNCPVLDCACSLSGDLGDEPATVTCAMSMGGKVSCTSPYFGYVVLCVHRRKNWFGVFYAWAYPRTSFLHKEGAAPTGCHVWQDPARLLVLGGCPKMGCVRGLFEGCSISLAYGVIASSPACQSSGSSMAGLRAPSAGACLELALGGHFV
eukprot:scaffold311842_cov18-Tisochrysis_lutea.AAC.3